MQSAFRTTMIYLTALCCGAAASVVVGVAGQWTGPVVAVLALLSGITFFDLRRRDLIEPVGSPDHTRDPFGCAMQLAFLGILSAAAWDNRWRDPWTMPGASEALGVSMLGAGMWLRSSAARVLGRHFTVTLSIQHDQRLVSLGPYRHLRHPGYTALLAIALGTAAVVRSPTAAVVSVVVWLPMALLRIRDEERALRRRFGTAYAEYSRRSWCLVPGIY